MLVPLVHEVLLHLKRGSRQENAATHESHSSGRKSISTVHDVWHSEILDCWMKAR